jgi:hypothetical protein
MEAHLPTRLRTLRWEFVDGTTAADVGAWADKDPTKIVVKGQACAASHLRALRRAHEAGPSAPPFVVVLEDDVELHPRFEEVVTEAAARWGELGAGVLQLGWIPCEPLRNFVQRAIDFPHEPRLAGGEVLLLRRHVMGLQCTMFLRASLARMRPVWEAPTARAAGAAAAALTGHEWLDTDDTAFHADCLVPFLFRRMLAAWPMVALEKDGGRSLLAPPGEKEQILQTCWRPYYEHWSARAAAWVW